MIVVCDTSPLIFFAKLQKFSFLQTLYQQIIIPQQVYEEVIKGQGKPGVKEVKKAIGGWITINDIKNLNMAKELLDGYGLDKGESAAIVLAQELDAHFLFTDDGPARNIAFNLFKNTRTKVSGTIGILQFARQKGLISKMQFRSMINHLKKEGFYITEAFFQRLIK